MNLVERGIDNFPCVSHSGEKNGCGASETRRGLAYIIIPHLTPGEPVTHKEWREGSSSPPPRNVSCRSANFQQISHEKAAGACGARRGAGSPAAWPRRRPLPGSRFPSASQVQAGVKSWPCLLSQDVGFTSQVFPEFAKILGVFFFFFGWVFGVGWLGFCFCFFFSGGCLQGA